MSHVCSDMLCENDHRCDCGRCLRCHDAHLQGDIKEFWGDCLRCAEQISFDMAAGRRCLHGNFVPDGFNTDIPCEECERFYAIAA